MKTLHRLLAAAIVIMLLTFVQLLLVGWQSQPKRKRKR